MQPATSNPTPAYVIITPARDEARYIEGILNSVIQQSITPTEWVIVNDGSTDETGPIVDRYAARYPWIKPLHVSNRGFRDADVGAIGAFVEGYAALETAHWDYLVNLDADLQLPPDYFARCFEEFRKDSALGIGGGTLYCLPQGGGERIEAGPRHHVRGATKIYRRACWGATGGLVAAPAWDTLDEVKAHLAGWCVRSFPEIRALHRRPTGQEGGTWKDAAKNGRSDYFLGYHPVFMAAKCAQRLFKRPYLVGGLGHFYGYLTGYVARRPRSDEAVIRYVRREQLRRLLLMESQWQ